MKFLVVGNGAREHAIAWKLRFSRIVTDLIVTPGNAGTQQIARNIPIEAEDIDSLLAFAIKESVDCAVIGPEAPLVAGIADRFCDVGIPLFGPTAAASKIESSKSFAKDLMVDCGVPTATAESFDDSDDALDYLNGISMPVVIKSDGLAAGKGVVVANNLEEAIEAVKWIMIQRPFGDAGNRILIEEYLTGVEASVFAFVDGQFVSDLVAACDYKPVNDGDVGPNTGGMGSFSSPPFWNSELDYRVRHEIMEPIVSAMFKKGIPYRGILYAGLMLTEDGPKVIEFNCRLGDPEAQTILPRLNADLGKIILDAVTGKLSTTSIKWSGSSTVSVVVASGGYPGNYNTGYVVDGLGLVDSDITIFHAGTKSVSTGGSEEIITNGGRVLSLMALSDTVESARQKIYENIERISFRDSFYRSDIGALGGRLTN